MPDPTPKPGISLLDQVVQLGRQAQTTALSFALHDYATDLTFFYRASRTFHAASTIKLAILLGLFKAAESGRLKLGDRLHVRNRFRSQADGSPFSCNPTATATRSFTATSAGRPACKASRRP